MQEEFCIPDRNTTCSEMENLTQEENRYLSCLLDDLTGTEEMVAVRKDYCKIDDSLKSCNAEYNIYFTGSKAEGLDLPGSDEDFMEDTNNILDIEVSESTQGFVQSTQINKFLLVTENVRPGFVLLRLRELPLPNQLFQTSLVHLGNNDYLSSQLYVSHFIALAQQDKHDIGYTRKVQGPSIETWTPASDRSKDGDDHVHSIRCNFWPSSAKEWIGRSRQYEWPSSQDKESIIAFGCHLVPIGHPLSTSKSMEWRISFSMAERILVWSFNHTQMQCYAVMKLILKEFVKVKSTQQHKGVLCSYFIKTFLFWMYEAKNPSFWQTAKLKECLTYLFHEFYTCIENGVLRHYFFPCFNLLEIKLTPDAQRELLTHFRALIDGGISMIGQCASLSGIWAKFCQHRERNATEEYMRHALQHDIHTSDVFLMKKLTIITLNVTNLFLPNENRGTNYSVLAELDAGIQDHAFSKLPFFTKQLIFLYKNIEVLNCSSRENKLRYKHLKFLDNNVFGSDIALSKLWLATFLLQQGDFCGSLQKINDVLSAIPPYALYEEECWRPDARAKQLYRDMFRNTNVVNRAKDAWLFDILVRENNFQFVPRGIQIQLIHGLPKIGVQVSPFTYAYYLMFLCYHELRQYDDRNCALRELIDTVFDDRRSSSFLYQSYNIVGHCLLVVGNTDMAQEIFLESAHSTHSCHPFIDKYNPAYYYLSCISPALNRKNLDELFKSSSWIKHEIWYTCCCDQYKEI